jgi:membrane associated rhomboid family serine protease
LPLCVLASLRLYFEQMFPYKDELPTLRTPVVTFALIAINVIAWLVVQGAGTDPMLEQSVCSLGVIPGRLFGHIPVGATIPLGPGMSCEVGTLSPWATLLTSMFMHGGWMHLILNMLFLWVFGNNIEDSTGRLRFVVFYLACGVAGALAQSFVNPGSRIPMVGASGAISGVMGAYIVLHPRAKVHMLVVLVFLITRIRVPAYLMLGYWFLLQLLGGIPGLGKDVGGTAFLAHVGGFVAGAALILIFRNQRLLDLHPHRASVRW